MPAHQRFFIFFATSLSLILLSASLVFGGALKYQVAGRFADLANNGVIHREALHKVRWESFGSRDPQRAANFFLGSAIRSYNILAVISSISLLGAIAYGVWIESRYRKKVHDPRLK